PGCGSSSSSSSPPCCRSTASRPDPPTRLRPERRRTRSIVMKIERREIIAAGGLAAFAAGFSQTLGRVVSNFTGEKEPRFAEGRHIHGRSPEPEYTVDP